MAKKINRIKIYGMVCNIKDETIEQKESDDNVMFVVKLPGRNQYILNIYTAAMGKPMCDSAAKFYLHYDIDFVRLMFYLHL